MYESLPKVKMRQTKRRVAKISQTVKHEKCETSNKALFFRSHASMHHSPLRQLNWKISCANIWQTQKIEAPSWGWASATYTCYGWLNDTEPLSSFYFADSIARCGCAYNFSSINACSIVYISRSLSPARRKSHPERYVSEWAGGQHRNQFYFEFRSIFSRSGIVQIRVGTVAFHWSGNIWFATNK